MQAARTTVPSMPPTPSPNDSETLVASQTAATRVGPVPDAPSQSELEDVLYDLLASGGDFNFSGEKLELIQSFLHEHARQNKTHAQFVTFFQEHELCMRPERPNLLSLPLVDSASRHAAVRAPVLVDEASEPRLQAPVSEPIYVESRSRIAWAWAGLALIAVSGMLALGIVAVRELRSELVRLDAAVAHSALEIRELRAETERLRETAKITSDVAQRTEQDTQLLVETLTPPPFVKNSR